MEELKNKFRVIELNREAILPHCAMGNSARVLLFRKIFEYCILNQYAIITTTHFQEWINFYNRLSFLELKGLRFKYSNTDLEKVMVYFADEENIKKMNDQLRYNENEVEIEKC